MLVADRSRPPIGYSDRDDTCPACGHELSLSVAYRGLLQALRITSRKPGCGDGVVVQDALTDWFDYCSCDDIGHLLNAGA